MKLYPLILATLLLSGCATKTIQVLDREGKPVAGALVFSQQIPYIWQPWKIAAYETDAEGRAKIVHAPVTILKPGYFPVIDGEDVGGDDLRDNSVPFSKTIAIYPMADSAAVKFKRAIHTTDTPVAENLYQFPLQLCGLTQLEYNIESGNMSVRSEHRNLIPSKRFFFVGPQSGEALEQISQKDGLAFYCRDQGSLYKIGANVLSKVALKGRPAHRVSILTAKLPSEEAYIQPSPRCMDKGDTRYFSVGHYYRRTPPEVHVSLGIGEFMRGMKSAIPCANGHSDKLFEYLERYL